MITIKRKATFANAKQRRKNAEAQAVRVPRVARLMALAIRFDQLIRDGVVTDQAELARLGQVSRARVTQIMHLLNLAPDIQEALLFLYHGAGRHAITERHIRRLVCNTHWAAQKAIWASPPIPPQAICEGDFE